MKLKRIISALVVFTLVMTCAVCSVSADAVHNVTTTYGVGSTDITINASVSGLTDGDMVSYIIYQPVEGTEGVVENGDGSNNILHIDQATIGGEGFATVTAPFSYFKGAKVQFVANSGTKINADTTGSYYGKDRVDSVSEFTDWQTSVVFYNDSASAGAVNYYYVTKDGNVQHVGDISTNYGTANKDKTELVETSVQKLPMDAAAYIVDFRTKYEPGKMRGTNHKIQFVTQKGSFNGTQASASSSAWYYDTTTVATAEQYVINGRYKENIEDGTFAGFELKGGMMIGVIDKNTPWNGHDSDGDGSPNYTTAGDAVYGSNGTDGTVGTGQGYIAIDANPIFSDYVKANGNTYPSVTFLATASSDAMTQTEVGLAIYKYPNGTFDGGNGATRIENEDGTVSVPAKELLGYYPAAAYADGGKFAIQLFDGSVEKEWINNDKYDYEAVPYVVDSNDNIVELTVFGENAVDGTYYFYSVDRSTTKTEGAFVTE